MISTTLDAPCRHVCFFMHSVSRVVSTPHVSLFAYVWLRHVHGVPSLGPGFCATIVQSIAHGTQRFLADPPSMRLFGISQWMQRPFADILHLYRMLFNEEAARTLSAVKKKYATRVVIYTRRPSLLYYSSCFRPDKLIALRFW